MKKVDKNTTAKNADKTQKRCSKDYKTTESSIKAHATWPNKTHDFDVTVSLVDADTAVQLDYPKPMRRRVQYYSDLNITIGHIAQALIEKWRLKKKEEEDAQKEESRGGISAMEFALREVSKRKVELLPWRASTSKDRIKFFRRNILPKIERCKDSDDFSKDDLLALKNDLFDGLKRRAREENREGITLSDIGDRLTQAQIIYDAILEIDPELPRLRINDYSCNSTKDQKEQMKSLPYAVHREFRRRVEALIIEDPKFARAAALMDSGGLRSGEASAVTIGKIQDYGHFALVWVLQQESEGMISNVTKTLDGYRMTILDEWGTEIVRKCNELIVEEDEIYFAPLLDRELSVKVRKLLEESGCSKDIFDEVERELEDTKNMSKDISAHILRRNRASIWRNICGFLQWEIDYLLGHKNLMDIFEKGNPKDEKTINRWVKMMNRYDTDRRNGEDPEELLISIDRPTRDEIIPFVKTRFVNSGNTPLKISFKLETAEMNDSILFIFGESYFNSIESDTVLIKGRRKNINLIERI